MTATFNPVKYDRILCQICRRLVPKSHHSPQVPPMTSSFPSLALCLLFYPWPPTNWAPSTWNLVWPVVAPNIHPPPTWIFVFNFHTIHCRIRCSWEGRSLAQRVGNFDEHFGERKLLFNAGVSGILSDIATTWPIDMYGTCAGEWKYFAGVDPSTTSVAVLGPVDVRIRLLTAGTASIAMIA